MPTSNNPDAPLDIDALDRELKDCADHEAYLANFTRRHGKRLLERLADCRAAMEPFFQCQGVGSPPQRDWNDLVDVCQTVKLAAADRKEPAPCK